MSTKQPMSSSISLNSNHNNNINVGNSFTSQPSAATASSTDATASDAPATDSFASKTQTGTRTKSLGFYVSDQAKSLLKKVYEDSNIIEMPSQDNNNNTNNISGTNSYNSNASRQSNGLAMTFSKESITNGFLKSNFNENQNIHYQNGNLSNDAPPPASPPPPPPLSPSMSSSPAKMGWLPPPPESPTKGGFGLSSPEKKILLSIAPPSPSTFYTNGSLSPSMVPPPPSSMSPSHAGLKLLGEALDMTSSDGNQTINAQQDEEEGNEKKGRATTVVSKLRDMRKSVKGDAGNANKMAMSNHKKISNAYINEAIGSSNTFFGRSLDLLSPDQFSVLAENGLFTPKSIRDGHRLLSVLAENDILVVGASLRTGAAAVAKVVDGLIHPGKAQQESVTKRIPWVESKYNELNPVVGRAVHGEDNRRGYLTYFSCNVIQSQCIAHKKKGEIPKIIVVIRHPIDARLSYFRYARRMYRKVTKDEKSSADFDNYMVADDFSRIPLAPVINQAHSQEGNSYEGNLCKWLHFHAQHKENVLFVFYEDLIFNTQLVVNEITSFLQIEASQTRKAEIIHEVTKNDPEYPIGNPIVEIDGEKIKRRTGSSNKGHLKFCPMSVGYIHYQWKLKIAQSFSSYTSFEALYSKFRQSPFPFPPRELLDAMADVTPGSAPNNGANGASGTRKSLIPGKRSSTHVKNLSQSMSKESADAIAGLFAGNEEILVKEIAKRYPQSYAARKELGISPSEIDHAMKIGVPANSAPEKRKSSRFSVLSVFRRSSSLPANQQTKPSTSDIDTATMPSSSTLQTHHKPTQSIEGRISISLQEKIDSDDSDEEDNE